MRLRLAVLLILSAVATLVAADPETPRVDGPWWRIAAPPALERHAKPGVQTVDFTVFQAGDGTWQLVSCVRGTAAPGGGRLLYRWQAARLEDSDWKPCGILAEADPALGHKEGTVQAPHCVRDGGRWRMFCNSNGARCLDSADGIAFAWAKNDAGADRFFDMARDVQLLDNRTVDGKWYAFYTDVRAGLYPERKNHTVSFRTAATLGGKWSASADIGVLTPTKAGDDYVFAEAESPFIVRRGEWYYRWEQLDVYASRSPTDWSGARRVELIPGGRRTYLAPEIVEHGGASYIAGYKDHGKGGIWMARLGWSAP
jgi:hypothetical protein